MDETSVGTTSVDETSVDTTSGADQTSDDRRRTLWRTSWGVVLAAGAAFSAGYAASRASEPSVGASRPPAWPLFVSLLVVAVSLWFVLAPTLRQWPFARPVDDEHEHDRNAPPEPWLVELSDADDAG